MSFLDIYIVFISAFLASVLYTWFGVAYSLTLLALMKIIMGKINILITVVLLSQLTAALYTSFYRRRIGLSTNRDDRNIIIISLTSIISFLTALIIGIKINDVNRSYLVNLFLLISGLLVILTKKGKAGKSYNEEKISVLTGILGGFVKGVIGAGITPILVSLQSLTGLNFDNVVHRTIFSEILVIIMVFIPYYITYDIIWSIALAASLGALIGGHLGYIFSKHIKENTKRLVSGIFMIMLSIIMMISTSIG